MFTRKLLRRSRKSHSSALRPRKNRRAASPLAAVERLEDRTLLSVEALFGTDGLDFAQTADGAPPDTIAAVGPGYVVEAVNTDVAIYDKTDGSEVFHQDLGTFFASVRSGNFMSDPVVVYDEAAQRFMVGVLDLSIDPFFGTVTGDNFLFAVSDSSDPMQDTNGDGSAFSEMHSINMTGSSGVFADYPRIGWNADAYFVSFNMFTTGLFNFYDHASIVAIDKGSVTDLDSSTLAGTITNRDTSHFTMAPATMHGSNPGDPEYLVEEGIDASGNPTGQLRVTAMHNALTNPTFTDTLITVDPYTQPPAAAQQGSSALMETNDTRILNAEWRDNRLVAAQTVGIAGDGQAHARFYEFDTSSPNPTLTQQGTIGVGSGSSSYFPSIAIAPNGDLGMTYIQSSSNEFVSMYVTAQTSGDPAGTMETPVLAKAGETSYSATFDSSPYRAGDYSGITVDPVDGSFWAANQYAKTPVDPRANWGTWIQNFRVQSGPADTTPPAAPMGLTVISPPGTSGTLFLDWDNNGEPDLAGYNVYRDGGLIASVGATSEYSDSGLTNGTTYNYEVTAVDTSGNESDPSSPASGTPSDTEAPAAPQNLTATSGDTEVTLNWDSNSESDLDGYNVYRSTTDGGPYGFVATVGTSTTPSFTDSGLTNGTTYYYVLTAFDTASPLNESGNSNQASGTPGDFQAPAIPTGLSATGGDQQVTLNWNAVGDSDLASYNVYRRTGGGSYSVIASVAKTETSYVDSGLTNGTTYEYVVTAVDLAGNESGQSAPASATPSDSVAPAAPTGLQATANSSQIDLTWNANSESDLAGYNVYRSTTSGSGYMKLNTTALVTSTSFSDTDVTPDTPYFYVVTAVDTSGNESGNSVEATATVPATQGSANDIYNWDMEWSDVERGNWITVTVVVTIKQDSNADGIAESSDANVRGANLTVVIDHYQYLAGIPFLIATTTFSNVSTNGKGQVKLNLKTQLGGGDFVATITSLSDGAPLTWNPDLDQDSPSYYEGVPGGHEVDQLPYLTSLGAANFGVFGAHTVVTSQNEAVEAPLGVAGNAPPAISPRFVFHRPVPLRLSTGDDGIYLLPETGSATSGGKGSAGRSSGSTSHQSATDGLFTLLSANSGLAEQVFDRVLV